MQVWAETVGDGEGAALKMRLRMENKNGVYIIMALAVFSHFVLV